MDQRKCGALVIATIHLPASVIIDNYLNDVANKSIYLSAKMSEILDPKIPPIINSAVK